VERPVRAGALRSAGKASPSSDRARAAAPRTAAPRTADSRRARPAPAELPVKEPLPDIPAELLEEPKTAKSRKPRGKREDNARPLTALTTILAQLEDAKAEQIVTITLDDKTAIADTMVVASGRSGRHVGAIADQIVGKLKANGYRDLRIEGMPQCDWVLVDAGDVVVHIFRPEVRSFYNLEKLWSSNAPDERVVG
jgi:ribosome-associated protein